MADATEQLKTFKLDQRNARRHDERNLEMIEDSIRDVGTARSIVVDEENVILAGNATVQAALRAGITGVRVIEADGTELVAVRRSGLTPDQKLTLALADNRAAELADWDPAVLTALQEDGVDLSPFWDDEELGALLATRDDSPEPLVDPDTVPDPPKEATTKPGDLWQIGRHRLMCSDSTNADDVNRLIDAVTIGMIVTDPPYSSGGFQDGLKRGSTSIGSRGNERIARDNLTSRGFLALIGRVLGNVDADVCYMFTDWRMWSWVFDALESSGYPVRNMIVWDKGQMGMGFPWRNQHELIAFAKRTPAKIMDGKRGNVLQATRTGNENHPTEKPVSLLSDLIDNTDGEWVYDPFGGSGSTLIACEQTGRRCAMMEIDPIYCDVIIARAAQTFGLVAELVS